MIGSSFHFKYKSSGVFYCLIILFFINLWKIRIMLAEFGRFYRADTYNSRGVTALHANLQKNNLPAFFFYKWIAWDLQCASCPITQSTTTHEQSIRIFYFEKGKATCKHFSWASCWSRGWGVANFASCAAITYAILHFLSMLALD